MKTNLRCCKNEKVSLIIQLTKWSFNKSIFNLFRHLHRTFSNKSLILLIVFASALLETSAKKKIECEEFDDEKWSTYGSLKTCYMKKAIKIRKDDSLITSEPDHSVNGLAFLANKKVHFLPINIAESFPNLLGLSSWGCPIKIISRKHLKNLHKLKLLNLGRNKIEIIKKDTFKDLRSLEWIGLSIVLINLICNFSFMFRNHFRLDQGKIKHLNAAAFDGLLKLHTVYIDRLGRKCNLRPILIVLYISTETSALTRISKIATRLRKCIKSLRKTVDSQNLTNLQSHAVTMRKIF